MRLPWSRWLQNLPRRMRIARTAHSHAHAQTHAHAQSHAHARAQSHAHAHAHTHAQPKLPRAIRKLQDETAIAKFVCSEKFAHFIEKPRAENSPPQAPNPKAVIANFAPLAVLPKHLARHLRAKTKTLRLTEPVADKQWRRHGKGMTYKRARQRRWREVPTEWYADIPQLLGEVPQIEGDRRTFYSESLGRILVVGLDARKNPVLISYYRKTPAQKPQK